MSRRSSVVPPTDPPRRWRRPDGLAVLTWLAIALATAAVLAETVALRDAGRRLRAQEAREAAAREAAARR